jgi:hypothetical protein
MSSQSLHREQGAMNSLEIALRWRQSGNIPGELSTLSSVIRQFTGIAVEQFQTAAEGIAYLSANQIPTNLSRMAELNQQVYKALLRDRQPTLGAVDQEIITVHVTWLLQDWPSGETLLQIALDPFVRKFFPLTRFWAEYYRALGCLAAGEPYTPVIPKVRGYERYWVPYLNLVADLTNRRDVTASRQVIADHFTARNRDRRLIDWHMIDGDGKHPVRWDLREMSLIQFAAHAGYLPT